MKRLLITINTLSLIRKDLNTSWHFSLLKVLLKWHYPPWPCNTSLYCEQDVNTIIVSVWGRNSSVGSAWARCPQRRGFDPPLGTFSGRGDFSLGVNMDSNSIPPKNSFGWEYKSRSSLCTHAFHRMDSKDPDVHVLDGWMPATKTHPARTIHEDGMWLP